MAQAAQGVGARSLHRTPERSAFDTVRYGEWILENDELYALGDDLWSFLEQLGLASAELGKYELADLCLSRLTTRFPESSRVVLFQGTVLESKGLLKEAQLLYEEFLRKEPSHLVRALTNAVDRQTPHCCNAWPTQWPA